MLLAECRVEKKTKTTSLVVSCEDLYFERSLFFWFKMPPKIAKGKLWKGAKKVVKNGGGSATKARPKAKAVAKHVAKSANRYRANSVQYRALSPEEIGRRSWDFFDASKHQWAPPPPVPDQVAEFTNVDGTTRWTVKSPDPNEDTSQWAQFWIERILKYTFYFFNGRHQKFVVCTWKDQSVTWFCTERIIHVRLDWLQ